MTDLLPAIVNPDYLICRRNKKASSGTSGEGFLTPLFLVPSRSCLIQATYFVNGRRAEPLTAGQVDGRFLFNMLILLIVAGFVNTHERWAENSIGAFFINISLFSIPFSRLFHAVKGSLYLERWI